MFLRTRCGLKRIFGADADRKAAWGKMIREQDEFHGRFCPEISLEETASAP